MDTQNWFELKGDETLALDWPLDENSHVIEIGGFEGRWAGQMWNKFHCHITIFEPQGWAVQRMTDRFQGIEKITIHSYGIWLEEGTFSMGSFGTDGTSMLSAKAPHEIANFMYFGDVLRVPADVVLMNIEGAEYPLIPQMVENGIMDKFVHFWCQFHPINERDKRHLEIFEIMGKTHEMIWNCFPTAVAWRRR